MTDRGDPEENESGFNIVPSESRELAYEKAYTCPSCGSVFNKDKVFCPSCGLSIQELQQPVEYDGYAAERGIRRVDRSARVFAVLSLILGIAGPLALGIGWLLAIIFGFTALNLFRLRGGFSKDRKLALWGISIGFFWPVAVFALLSLFSYNIASERLIRRNETAVERFLIDIAVAQRFIKYGHFLQDGGKSRYAQADDFGDIEHRLVPESVPDYYMGYDIRVRAAPAGGFRVSASPERYGRTGRRSFFIDDTGILRGGDDGAARSFAGLDVLPDIRGKSVYEDYDNIIVENLVSLARGLAAAGDFDRAEKILVEIRSEFYMMPAAAGIEDAMRNLEQHVYEEEAGSIYREALSLIDEERLPEAIAMLRSLKADYGGARVISEAESSLAGAEGKLSDMLESKAEEIFKEARMLEKKREYSGAIELYRRVEREFESASIREKASELAGTVEARKLENEAEEIFAGISGLDIEESYNEAISAVNSLLNHYASTEKVKKNLSGLQKILDTAIGEREKNKAVAAFQQGNFNAAIQAGESAIEANRALRGRIIPLLRHSYLRRAEDLYENKAYAEAVPYYEKWMNISDYRNTPEYKNFHSALYEHARKKFLAGEYAEAVNLLGKTGRRFAGRSEFWYMMGAGAAMEKDYSAAVSMFRRSLSIDGDNPGALLKKAFCEMIFLQQKEEELKELLGGLSGLRRGADLFYEINSLVNSLNAKDLEIKHLAAGTGGGEAGERRRARLPAERDAFEAQTRTKMFELQNEITRNDELRGRIISKAESLHDSYNQINSYLIKLPSGYGRRPRGEFERLFREKRREFAGVLDLERGLNQEMRLEGNAILHLEFALTRFGQERSFDAELRAMYRLREDIDRIRMRRQLEEGRGKLMKALELKIPVEEHLEGLSRLKRN